MGLIKPKLPPRDSIQPLSLPCRLTGAGEAETRRLSPWVLVGAWLCKLLCPCCVWSMCINLMILMGTKFGAAAWSRGPRPVCSHPLGTLLFLVGCFNFSCRHWVFCSQGPKCCSQFLLLSSAQRSQLEASSGLRSACFSVVYGQAKRNCPHGQLVRAPRCQLRLSVMLPNAHGHRIIYFLGSPFCLIKRKKKILLYLKQNQPVLSPPTPHSIMIKIAT